MEDLVSFWHGRRALVTGHSGFIGSWLTLALAELGAQPAGLALPPPTDPSHFDVAGIGDRCDCHWVDIRDQDATARAVAAIEPEIVFHLAAQPLVRAAYADPVATFATNVMGTVHVLDAVARCPSVRAVVVFTTDKVYENLEWPWPYREADRLGGFEPYGLSKAAAELMVESYRRSSFGRYGSKAVVATVRAGNVIGGGDWAADRLIPDAIRAFSAGQPLVIRNPAAIRPWQHVLEPVAASLHLARALVETPDRAQGSWNIGPALEDARPVSWIAERLSAEWPGSPGWRAESVEGPYEAGILKLDSSKANAELGWRPRWGVAEAVARTAEWYRHFTLGGDVGQLSRQQIESYLNHG